jgi:hypothetical protein
MLGPALFIRYPTWLGIMHEVLSLGPSILRIRRAFWRFGSTRLFKLDQVRNFRVKMVCIGGFCFETIYFDHDPELGVIHAFGLHLDEDEAQSLIGAIAQWQRASRQH